MEKKQKHILIVEDEIFLSNLLKLNLEKEGFEVTQVFDGKNVTKELLIEKKIDLILLDLILPDKNGFVLLEEIKKDPMLSKIPVVILSNLGQEEDILRGKKLGVKDYFVKAKESIESIVKKVKNILKVEE
ncbi:response regulator [bacterium]|nr:response regulator [bacterium]